jgi:hypothetical protein
MEEVSEGKEVEADTALLSPSKHCPTGEKRKRITEVQKLEINGGEQKIPRTEKGTASVYKRREKGSPNEREQMRTGKGSPVAQERKTRGNGGKQKKSRNPAVVAKDSKEDKVGAHQDKSTSKVRKAEALPTWFFLKLHA